MKKLKYFFFILVMFFVYNNANAETINSIDMDVSLNSDGSADVFETWDVNATEGTEYYHTFQKLNNSKISDFTVCDENECYEETKWNINASLKEKAYKYGYNYINDDNGVELCFGKSSYGKHTYSLSYHISNFVTRIDDADIIMSNMFEAGLDINSASIEIHPYEYIENMNVKTYKKIGSEISNGEININSNGVLAKGESMSFIIKFPKNTFNTDSVEDGNYSEWLKKADLYYGGIYDLKELIWSILSSIIYSLLGFYILCIYLPFKSSKMSGSIKLKYGKKGRNLPIFVKPTSKILTSDIYREYWLFCNYFRWMSTDQIYNVVLLKWVIDGNIEVKTEGKKEYIYLKKEPEFYLEKKIYDIYKEASKDNIVSLDDLRTSCKKDKNIISLSGWLIEVLDYENNELIKEGKLTPINKGRKTIYLVNDSMYDEALEMKKLYKYMKKSKDFNNLADSQDINSYILYAALFLLKSKKIQQIQKLNPIFPSDFNYGTIVTFSSGSSSSSSSSGGMSGGGVSGSR